MPQTPLAWTARLATPSCRCDDPVISAISPGCVTPSPIIADEGIRAALHHGRARKQAEMPGGLGGERPDHLPRRDDLGRPFLP